MESIKEIVDQLGVEMNRVYGEYTDLHKELDTHRGQTLTETNIPEVNRLLKEIQDKFAYLYPAYHFIAIQHQYVTNAVNSYNDFIEGIKKAGAEQNEQCSN